MTIHLRIPGLLVAGWLAASLLPGQSAEESAKEVATLDARYQDAVKKNDAAAMNLILADDFVDVGANGAHRTKQQNVEDTRSHVIQWTRLVATNEQVRVFDSTAAAVTGEQDGAGTYNGQPFARKTRYLRLYLKRNGRWQNVAAQSSPTTP